MGEMRVIPPEDPEYGRVWMDAKKREDYTHYVYSQAENLWFHLPDVPDDLIETKMAMYHGHAIPTTTGEGGNCYVQVRWVTLYMCPYMFIDLA